MANGTGRNLTFGIAAQPTFGTPVTASTYTLAVTNAPSIERSISKLLDTAQLGSVYSTDDIENGNRQATITLEGKVDENYLPLLLKQRFSITSVTASGETAVYQHTLAFTNTTNSWYTLQIDDSSNQSYYIQDALITNLKLTMNGEFITFSAEFAGAYPVTYSGSNVAVQPKTFVGRMATFKYANDGSTPTATNVLSSTATFEFGTNSDETKFFLGKQDLGTHELTQDTYLLEVTTLESGVGNVNDFTLNTAKEAQIVVTNTDRNVVGAVAATKPSFTIDIPYAKLQEYSTSYPTDDSKMETFKLMALDKVGEINAPAKLTVVNSVATY